jgi:hypothetical protein
MALASKQEQHAGDASNQYQANQIVVNNGLSEEQAMKVFQAMIPIALNSYIDMAASIAEERINQFKGKLLPRLEEIEGAFENFKDPAFQIQLRRAQISAAVSDQESDWDMLSQLMIKNIEVKEDRNKKLGVTKAIEIISEIDNQALLALTVLYAFLYLIPIEGNVNRGLDILEELYSKILYQELPENNTWIDHLEILKTIKIYPYKTSIKSSDICAETLDGYAAVGIKKDSADFEKARRLLQSIEMDAGAFVDNPLLKDYLVLPIVSKKMMEGIRLQKHGIESRLLPQDITVIQQIFNLYEDSNNKQIAIKNFMELWDKHPTLKQIHVWLDKIPFFIDLNIVGKVLAIANIRRVVPELKNLDIFDQ